MNNGILLISLFLVTFSLPLQQIHNVIIVGAGVSGLRASQILSQHHISHILLQSTNHTGGRVRPLDFAGIKVDEGASFIHHAKSDNPIASLVKQLKWPVANGTCSYKVVYFQGERKHSLPYETISEARKFYFKLSNQIIDRYDQRSDVSVLNAFRQVEAQDSFKSQSLLKKHLVHQIFQFLGNIDGTSLDQISAKNADYNETKPDLFPLPGYYKLIDTIFPPKARSFTYFNQRIHSIDYSGDIVKVKTHNKEYLAKKVIVSVSLGVLKANKITFYPPLPDKHRQSIQKIGFGVANKLFAKFSKPFWSAGDRWLSFFSKKGESKYPSAFVVPRRDKNILIFFVSGKMSLRLSRLSDNQLKKDLEQFLALFKHRSELMLEQVKQTRWHLEEDTLGSYTFYKVGTTSKDFQQLSKPINDKLWLAGQHTSHKTNACVHGAYLSGQRAAQEVTSSFEKPKEKQQINL